MNFNNIEDIKKLAKDIHTQNVEKGFWEEVNSDERQVALINSELYEAIEAHRKGRFANVNAYNEITVNNPQLTNINYFEKYIKDSVEDELADTWIRIVDWHYYLLWNKKGTDEFERSMCHSPTYEFEANINNLVYYVLRLRNSTHDLSFIRCSIEELCKKMNINLELHVQMKLEYNKSRIKYHGKKY